VILASCNKDITNNPEVPSDYEFRYVLQDTLGNEKTEFNQGENIVFSFQIINKGLIDVGIRNFLGGGLGLFRVNQIKTNGDTLNHGYPTVAVCEVGSFNINKNDTTEFNCPWVKSENNNFYHFCLQPHPEVPENYLPIGNYYTDFENSFVFLLGGTTDTTEVKYFKINFTVK
jgi:hypothetical protein